MSIRVRPLVTLEDVTKAYGVRVLLDGITAGVGEGNRIGVVGRNGGGKTTLLEVIAGETAADAGRVVRTGEAAVRLLSQSDALPSDATVRSAVLAGREEHEWAGDPAVRDVLTGLLGGLEAPSLQRGLDTRIGDMSGGERRRVALAALLAAPVTQSHDVLLLDEPTNHLDVEGVAWLAAHLNARPALRTGALVVVTHDRWFLDEVCTTTWEVQGGALHAYEGGYSAYVLAKAERERVAAGEESRRQNLLRKELAWLRRGPPARTSKPKFRIDAANALIEAEPPARDATALMRFAAARLGRTVAEVDDVVLRAGDRTLLDRLTWQLGPGDRLGLVGVNGAGKTTFLRLLTGEVQPVSGRVRVGSTVKYGYLSQQVEELADLADRRLLQAVEDVRQVLDLGNGRIITASQLCEQFGFTGERQSTRVGELSGGERRRLQLLRLLMEGPNVLLLDEPTNDLDVETLNALEDLLDGWAGSLVVVTHDRYFLERVCDRVAGLLGDGRLRDLPGGVEEYLRLRAKAGADAAQKATGDRPARASDAAAERTARKELARLERQLDKLAEREAGVHERMAAVAADYAEASRLDGELQQVAQEREALEERWLEVSEHLEQAG